MSIGAALREPAVRRRLRAPVAVGLGVLAATAFIGVVDPGEPGHYPTCPFLALTGWDCPFCGGLRATHALTRGDLAAAADHNLLFVVAVPFLVAAWVWWVIRTVRPAGTDQERPPTRGGNSALRWFFVVSAVLVVFAVVRNLPFGAWLGSGTW